MSFSVLIMNMVKDYVKKHKKSNNPQSVIEMFDRESVAAIPTLYEENLGPWEKFYDRISKEDYKELDTRINWLLQYHNKRLHQL